MKRLFGLILGILFFSCQQPEKNNATRYNDLGETGLKAGGVKMIPVQGGKYRVWTKRVGNNPTIKVLLLHGGPATTHEYFESFDSFLPKEGIEYYYYDQLGSYYSDQPSDSSLWTTERFVEEVEEVRKSLGLKHQFLFTRQLMGWHSRDGICTQVSEQFKGSNNFQHDGQRTGVWKICRRGALKTNGSSSTPGSTLTGSEKRFCQSSLFGIAAPELLY